MRQERQSRKERTMRRRRRQAIVYLMATMKE
jgi:hypothetical protein